MEEKTFLTRPIKIILASTILLLTALLFVIIGNPLKKPPAPTPLPAPQINKIEISADAKSILNAETKEAIFTITDAQKYLKDNGYFYNLDTFQDTNAKYEGDCFTGAALSSKKGGAIKNTNNSAEGRIIFSTGCLSGDLPQAWVGVYYFGIKELTLDCSVAGKSCRNDKENSIKKSFFQFLIGGSGRNFVWSSDDKTITYEADLGLSGMTEIRTIDSATGEILERKNTPVTSNSEIKGLPAITLPTDLKSIIFELAKKDYIREYEGMDFCGNKEITINDYRYGFEATDLNNDGLKEFIIEPMGFCDPTTFRGAQGNGAYDLFEKKNGLWKNIGGINGNGYQILGRKTDGYFDIVTTWHLGAASVGLTYYKWQKQEMTYKTMFTKDIELQENSNFDQEVNNFIESQNN